MPKVLIVDDEPNIVTSLEFLLAQAGHEVAIAGDGLEALEQARRFGPDLVVLDLMLPGLDGFAVCRTLRQLEPSPQILMITARGREVERIKGLDHGADAFITKPFSTRDFVRTVDRLLEARHG